MKKLQQIITESPERVVRVKHQNGTPLETQGSPIKRLSVVSDENNEWAYCLRQDCGAIVFFGVYGRYLRVEGNNIIVSFVTGKMCARVANLIKKKEEQGQREVNVTFAHPPTAL